MGTFVDFEQFKAVVKGHLGSDEEVYRKFRCYPVGMLVSDQLAEIRERSKDMSPRSNWYLTPTDREKRVVSQLRKQLD